LHCKGLSTNRESTKRGMRKLQEEIESVSKTRISFPRFQKAFLKLSEPCQLRVRKGHRFGPAYLTHISSERPPRDFEPSSMWITSKQGYGSYEWLSPNFLGHAEIIFHLKKASLLQNCRYGYSQRHEHGDGSYFGPFGVTRTLPIQ
jgi:hypothetical protein